MVQVTAQHCCCVGTDKAADACMCRYGYALATYKTGQHVGMTQLPNFLAHPPFDKTEVSGIGP